MLRTIWNQLILLFYGFGTFMKCVWAFCFSGYILLILIVFFAIQCTALAAFLKVVLFS